MSPEVMAMKLFMKKAWNWWDISLLKWSCFLFGIIVGAYIADIVQGNVWLLLAVAILFMIRPAVAYWKE